MEKEEMTGESFEIHLSCLWKLAFKNNMQGFQETCPWWPLLHLQHGDDLNAVKVPISLQAFPKLAIFVDWMGRPNEMHYFYFVARWLFYSFFLFNLTLFLKVLVRAEHLGSGLLHQGCQPNPNQFIGVFAQNRPEVTPTIWLAGWLSGSLCSTMLCR